MMLKIFIFIFIFLISGCQSKNEIENISSKVSILESKILEQDAKITLLQNSASNYRWVLWASKEWVNPNALNNFGWPKLISAFSSKEQCLQNAYGYVIPDGNIIGNDPYIVQDKNKTINFIYRCLPSEVTPKF
jgi:hypothetical protein